MTNLIKLSITRKKLLQHESITPIKSGITSSQILQGQPYCFDFLILPKMAVKCIAPMKTGANSHHKNPPFDIKQ